MELSCFTVALKVDLRQCTKQQTGYVKQSCFQLQKKLFTYTFNIVFKGGKPPTVDSKGSVLLVAASFNNISFDFEIILIPNTGSQHS